MYDHYVWSFPVLMRVCLILTQLSQDAIDPFIQKLHFKILTVEIRDQITYIKKVKSGISNENVFLPLQCASWEVDHHGETLLG